MLFPTYNSRRIDLIVPTIVLTILIVVIPGFSQTKPDYPIDAFSRMQQKTYGNHLVIPTDSEPDFGGIDTSFIGFTKCYGNTPYFGYPKHPGIVAGVNDTILVSVMIENRTDDPIVLTSYSPENWVDPVQYRSLYDLKQGFKNATSSELSFSFSHWAANNFLNKPVSQPDTLFNWSDLIVRSAPRIANYSMIFKVWNLPLGKGTVVMEKSLSAPSDFTIYPYEVGDYWYEEPESVKDTINAFIQLAEYANYRDQPTMALGWLDSAFVRNDSCLGAWMYKAHTYMMLQDTLSVLSSFDKVMSIYTNNSDPLMNLSDTLAGYWEYLRAKDIYDFAIYRNWMYETGENPRIW